MKSHFIHRPDEVAAVVNPVRAGHLAVAVEGVHAGPRRLRLRIAAERQDRGHAGAHRPPARHQRSVALDPGAVADLDSRHVGDGIVRSVCPGKGSPMSRPRGLVMFAILSSGLATSGTVPAMPLRAGTPVSGTRRW